MPLKAVTPTIPLVPTTNPWPFENFFNLDMTLSRPIKLAKLREGMSLEPIAQAFNLFNNNSRGTYGGSLNTGFGSLNYDYNSPTNIASTDCAVTNNVTGTTVQSCLKGTGAFACPHQLQPSVPCWDSAQLLGLLPNYEYEGEGFPHPLFLDFLPWSKPCSGSRIRLASQPIARMCDECSSHGGVEGETMIGRIPYQQRPAARSSPWYPRSP